MQRLTEKQECFISFLVVDGLDEREAYKKAYPKSVSWKEGSIDEAVSKLMNDERVLKRYEFVSEEFTRKTIEENGKSLTGNDGANVNIDEAKNEKGSLNEDECFFTRKEATDNLKWVVKEATKDLAENGFKQASSSAFFNAMKLLIELEGLKPDVKVKIDKTKADIDKVNVEIKKLEGIAEEVEDLSEIE